MPKKPDPLDNLTPEGQLGVMKNLVFGLFGGERGASVWPHFEAGLGMKARQIGDADEPEKNYWKGAWRIHELD